MSRLQAAVFTALFLFVWIIIFVACFRVLEWLFAPQPWLWAVAIIIPITAGVVVFVIDSFTTKTPDA